MSEENKVYALVVEVICWSAFVTSIILFLVYVSGIIKPLIPFDQLPRAWALGARGAAREYGRPSGWKWLLYLHKSDMLCILGLSMFIFATIAALARVLAVFIKQKNLIFIVIVVCELAIMLFAASGLFAGGGFE